MPTANKITEKSLIPLSLVFIIITGTVWITVVAQDGKANTLATLRGEERDRQQDERQNHLEKELVKTREVMIEKMTRMESDLQYIKAKVRN